MVVIPKYLGLLRCFVPGVLCFSLVPNYSSAELTELMTILSFATYVRS